MHLVDFAEGSGELKNNKTLAHYEIRGLNTN